MASPGEARLKGRLAEAEFMGVLGSHRVSTDWVR